MKIIVTYDDTETLLKLQDVMIDGDDVFNSFMSITGLNTSQERERVWRLRRLLQNERIALRAALGDTIDATTNNETASAIRSSTQP